MMVQHVGPKLALGVLSNLSPDELVAAIGREDVARLDAIPGIGTRVAERIVRELRDKDTKRDQGIDDRLRANPSRAAPLPSKVRNRHSTLPANGRGTPLPNAV
jgi:holliday junction DNA helicase RuvA